MMYYMRLIWLPWQPYTTMYAYMVNFVNNLQKTVKKKDTPSPIPTILITGRQIWYVCVGVLLLL